MAMTTFVMDEPANFGTVIILINQIWLVTCGILVFFMQAGFAMLEAGAVRAKNTKNILLKNALDPCMSSLIWWGFGCSFAFGERRGGNGFIGSKQFFLSGYKACEGAFCPLNEIPDGISFDRWFYNWAFSAVAATIVSGAVAERCQFGAYMLYTAIVTGFIYPVVVHWCWSTEGWLSPFYNNDKGYDRVHFGLLDGAGSGVVHLVGGSAAFAGAKILGPRIGRYDYDGKIKAMAGHSTALMSLGMFVLWMGWYGFNCGAAFTARNVAAGGIISARIAVNTTMSASTSGLAALVVHVAMGNYPDVGPAINGILTGLVAICASAATIEPWAATVIGTLAGVLYYFASILLKLARIDDPLDASPVHAVGGMWGLIAAGLFSTEAMVDAVYGPGRGYGIFYGDDGKQLGVQILGCVAIFGFATGTSAILFHLMNLGGFFRVSQSDEFMGMDVSYHGGSAYEWQMSTGSGHNMGGTPPLMPHGAAARAIQMRANSAASGGGDSGRSSPHNGGGSTPPLGHGGGHPKPHLPSAIISTAGGDNAI